MTGPEHYAEAERLVDLSALDAYDTDHSRYARADVLAEAQVHATLALAAAAALPAAAAYIGDEQGLWSLQREWTGATS